MKPVIESIDEYFDVSKAIKIIIKEETMKSHIVRLKGLICYSRKHYIAYMRNDNNVWFEFDDNKVKVSADLLFYNELIVF